MIDMTVLQSEVQVANPQKRDIITRVSDWVTGKQPKKDEPEFHRFETNPFLLETSVGQRGGEKAVRIPESLRQDYSHFLREHLKQLIDMNRRRPDILRDNPNHTHDRILVQLLAHDGRVNEAAITEFLKTQQGLDTTTIVLEHQTMRELFAMGMDAIAHQPGDRQRMPDTDRIELEFGRGVLHRVLGEKVVKHLYEPMFAVEGRRTNIPFLRSIRRYHLFYAGVGVAALSMAPLSTAATLAAIATGGGIGAIAGAAEGLASAIVGTVGAEAATMLVGRMLHPGVRLDARRCGITFDAISQDRREVEYMREMTGIDMDEYEHTRGLLGGPMLREMRARGRSTTQPEHTQNPERRKEKLIRNLKARIEYYKTIGIPEEQIDASPFDSITQGRSSLEQINTGTSARIRRYYEEGGIPADTEGQIRKMFGAQSRAAMELMQEYVDVNPKALRPMEELYEAVIAKREAFKEGGTRATQRKEELTEQKRPLGNVNTHLQTNYGHFNEVNTKLRTIQTSRDELRKELQITLGNLYATPELALHALNRVLDSAGTSVTINGNVINSLYDLYQNALNTRATQKQDAQRPVAAGGYTGRALEAEHERIDKVYEAKKAGIDESAAKVQEVISAINNKLIAIRTEQAALVPTEEVVRNVQQTVENLTAPFNTMTDPVTGWGITETDLQTQTIDVLMQQINKIHAANPAQGWPTERNNAERIRLERAIIEARAHVITVPSWAANVDFTEVVNRGISEIQIMTYTRDELLTELNTRRVLAGLAVYPPAMAANMDVVIQKAHGMFQARMAALQNRTNELTTAITNIDAQTEGVAFRDELSRVELTESMFNRWVNIIGQAEDVIDNRIAFTESRVPTGDDVMSREERDANEPLGYYEYMNLLFDYRNRPDRGAYFRRIHDFIPPNHLAAIFQQTMGLWPPGTPLATILTDMRVYIDNRDIAPENIRMVFRETIQYYAEQARTL